MTDNNNTRSKERNTRSGGKGGGLLAGILILSLLGGGVGYGINNGFFDGNGQGSGAGDQSGQSTTPDQTSDTVIIKIEESTVKVNDHVCKNEQELKDYLQEIHNDKKVWILEDDHAILSTYDMVVKVCKELNIDLKE